MTTIVHFVPEHLLGIFMGHLLAGKWYHLDLKRHETWPGEVRLTVSFDDGAEGKNFYEWGIQQTLQADNFLSAEDPS